jgi:hypothetical protein
MDLAFVHLETPIYSSQEHQIKASDMIVEGQIKTIQRNNYPSEFTFLREENKLNVFQYPID